MDFRKVHAAEMAIGQGGRHESFKWGRAALTATNDEIVTLVTLGWDIGRVVEH